MSAVPRSTFVTALAWTFIALAGFSSVMAVLQNIMLALVFPIEEMRAGMEKANDAHSMPGPFRFIAENFQLFLVLYLGVSVLTLVSAIGLLKRWNWARWIFIAMMAAGILWNLTGLAMPFLMASWMPMPEHTPADFRDQFDFMWKIMTVFTVVMSLAFAGLFAWIIKRLVSPQVKAEFGR